MSRDKEMDELQQELDAKINEMESGPKPAPFIHRPEEMDIKPGSLCWMDGTRVCGPDCVAYNVEDVDPETGEFLQGPNKCLALFYMGQQGAAALSQLIINRKRISEIQEKRLLDQLETPPPNPFGKR